MNIETAFQLLNTALVAVCAFSLNSMAGDIREIRADIKTHISDHTVHCKYPTTKGC